MGFGGEEQMLETQAKISIKRGLFFVSGLVWDCGLTIDLEELVWDCKPVIDL